MDKEELDLLKKAEEATDEMNKFFDYLKITII